MMKLHPDHYPYLFDSFAVWMICLNQVMIECHWKLLNRYIIIDIYWLLICYGDLQALWVVIDIILVKLVVL